MAPHDLARRYVAWLRRYALGVLAASALALAGAVYLVAFRLPLRADFSYLLPQDAAAVRDLRRIEGRVVAKGTVLVVVRAASAPAQAAATAAMLERVRALPAGLVEQIEADDAETRAFLRARKFLYVPVAELTAARDALQRRVEAAKLAANPLYIELDDPDPAAEAADRKQLDELRAKRDEAEARLARSANVSADGTVGLVVVRTAFGATDSSHGAALLAALTAARSVVRAAHPGVEIGFAGGVPTAVAEHDALLHGMLLSSLVTAVLVALVLILYFRSATLLTLLTVSLATATLVAFGVAALTVGHLNAATAFLGAIIAGNGVNYGILLIARFLEERRRHEVDDALAAAIVGTLRPTAVASLGAAIAYGSLAATSFRGFADFAIIGAVGMILCWVSAFTLLPALMLRLGRDTRIFYGDPFLGRLLVRLLGFRRPAMVVAGALVVAVGAGALVWRYVAADPFEYDIKNLRSAGAEAQAARHWTAVSDQHFGRGISGKTFVAADRADQVPRIVDALHALDAGVAADHRTIGAVSSILDVIPPDQEARLVVLAELRELLDDPALEALDDGQRAELAALRPPDELRAITVADLPEEIAGKLREKNGQVGLLVAVRPDLAVDEWNGHDLIRFASAIRRLELPGGETVTTSGSSVIFADIIGAIERDGLLVTAVAALGLVLMVVLVVGRNVRSFAVLTGTALGTLVMVAVCALLGLKVNFLDFVALPITLGLGIDYAINIAHRAGKEADLEPAAVLATSGSAVLVCSLTTIIGYGSLLVSENLAIRGFGLAALIGEITCLVAALAVVPSIVVFWRRLRAPRPSPEQAGPPAAAAA
ncbi:MAG: MMPL family transporter [Kofleriaceae bacterium]|nr:MMPL family transporter [Kofleriaceae bacterium]